MWKIILASILVTLAFSNAAASELPTLLTPITPANVQQVRELARYGKGLFNAQAHIKPDGKTVVIPGTLGLWLYSIENWNQSPQFIDFDAPTFDVGSSADGQWLAYTNWDGLQLADSQSVDVRQTIPNVSEFAFSPVAPMMAIVRQQVTQPESSQPPIDVIELRSLDGGQVLTQLTLPRLDSAPRYVTRIGFSPDGAYLGISWSEYPRDTCGLEPRWVEIWSVAALLAEPPATEPFLRMDEATDFIFAQRTPDVLIAVDDMANLEFIVQFVRVNLETGEQNHMEAGGTTGQLHLAALSPDEESLIVIQSGVLTRRDAHTGELLTTFEQAIPTRAARFTPEGELLIVGMDRLWLTDSELNLLRIIPLPDSMYGLLVNDDGTQAAFQGADDRLHIWHLDGPSVVAEVSFDLPEDFWRMEFAAGGAYIYAYDQRYNGRFYDPATGRVAIQPPQQDNVADWILPDEGLIIVGWAENVSLWRAFVGFSEFPSTLPDAGFRTVTANAAGDLLVIEETPTHFTVTHWNYLTGQFRQELGAFEDMFARAQLLADGSMVMLISQALNTDTSQRGLVYRLYLIDLTTGETLLTLDDISGVPSLSPDGSRIVLNDVRDSYVITVLDSRTGQPIFTPTSEGFAGFILGYNQRSDQMVIEVMSVYNCAGDFRALRLRDLNTGETRVEIGLPSGQPGNGVRYGYDLSTDGSVLLVANSLAFSAADTATGTIVFAPDSGGLVNAHDVAFQPSDSTFVTVGSDGTLRVWGP